MFHEVLATMVLKAIGALCGAALALMARPAKTTAEFATRLACSIMAGILFATPVRERLGWPLTDEYSIAASCLAAFIAWWVMAAVVKVIEKWEGPKR